MAGIISFPFDSPVTGRSATWRDGKTEHEWTYANDDCSHCGSTRIHVLDGFKPETCDRRGVALARALDRT